MNVVGIFIFKIRVKDVDDLMGIYIYIYIFGNNGCEIFDFWQG